MDRKTAPTTFRLSAEARTLLRELAQRFGLSQAAILELSVRKMATDNGTALVKEKTA